MRYLVSSCLLGVNCRYDGGNNYNQAVVDFLKDKDYVPVCPEQLGGLSTPREPAEILDGQVVTQGGGRVTGAFERGGEEALRLARLSGCTRGILKENSPSCGVNTRYDGTFSQQKIPGQGITARILREAGLALWSEMDFLE